MISSSAVAQASKATILWSKTLCKQPESYIGWPSVAVAKNGDILVVFSGDREGHVCPWGKTQMVRSSDNGETWSEPVTINNTPLDDRDAGILVTKKGTIIVSWFTSLAFDDPENLKHFPYPPELIATWKRHAEKLGPEIRKEWLGCWVRRSEDNGETWDDFIRVPVSAPHGPIELADGRLLFVGRRLWQDTTSIDVCESLDDGRSWQTIGTIPVPPGEDPKRFTEPHAIEMADGRILAMIRFEHPKLEDRYLYQSESTDGGKTWSVPKDTGIWGFPPHLIHVDDKRLLVAYGHRQQPYGERASISYDGGKTWDLENPIEIAKAKNWDLGYPSTVILPDSSLLTVYYQIEENGEKNCLMGTRWRLD